MSSRPSLAAGSISGWACVCQPLSVLSPSHILTWSQKGYREHRVLRISFWIKLAFVIIEVVLAVAFAACMATSHYNTAAVLEWIIAFIFSAYIFSFVVDLYPAAATKQKHVEFGNGDRGFKVPWTRRGQTPTALNPNNDDAAWEMEEARL